MVCSIPSLHPLQSITLHTTLGDLKIEIYCDIVPRSAEVFFRPSQLTHTQNFLALCGRGYYDNTLFHRNMKGFMIQGGDPTGTGKGGESVWGGPIPDEFSSVLKHSKRGIVSWANNGPNTNKSQFFITYSKQSHLNMQYTVFGHIIDGWDVLDQMERIPVDAKDRPLQPIRLVSATIHANPLASDV